MKHNRYRKLFGWLAVATMLLTTSCKDDLFGDFGQSDEVNVSFTLAPEAAAISTRGDSDDDDDNKYVNYNESHISDGTKADLLVYAVYDGEQDTLLLNYTDTDAALKAELEAEGFKYGDGQTVMKIDKFPVTINLTLKRGVKYKVAFWAQNRNTKAYNTADLRKVEVIYSELENEIAGDEEEPAMQVDEDGEEPSVAPKNTTPNNDEYRDAFCRSVEITPDGSGNISQNVYLYRPLAQINIGTSGYDYEIINRESNKKYTYSKVRINNVARYLDVVKDETILSTTGQTDEEADSESDPEAGTGAVVKTPEAFTVAEFGYAKIPAYVSINIPNYPSHTVYDWKHVIERDEDYIVYDDNGSVYADKTNYEEKYGGEEFLKVHLDGYKGQANQKGYTHLDDAGEYLAYASLNEHNGDKSETFKYLSMCYVLTSSKKDEPTVINNLKAWLATKDDGTDSIKILDINHVPAQRNWRTNIVGDLLTMEQTYVVKLDKDFAGEYNGWSNNGEWKDLSGKLAEGVYYDAKNDEIQISNANGLIWLQRMVNGDIFVRDEKGYPGQTGKDHYLEYYDESGNGVSHPFIYKGYDKPDDEELHQRILAATHVEDDIENDHPSNYDKVNHWPNWNNFNFDGATIKLMADIDLADIDWIPIGWDISLHDTSIARDTDDGKTDVTIDYLNAEYIHGKRRIFCGTFDGNGHTIKNLKTFRVGANVHKDSQQTRKRGPYDNFQWYPYGLFGMVVDHAKIQNVRLQNVDIKGYDACGALVGIVFSGDNQSGNMFIKDCYVDGGTVSISPMYRGDSNNGTKDQDRTFARGVFCGGLVGDIVIAEPNKNEEPKFELTGCDVRNLTIRAYRQVGGLVGGIGNYENYREDEDYNGTGEWRNRPWEWKKQKFDLNISGNTISNVLVICNQFQAFNKLLNAWEGDKVNNTTVANSETWRNGFGWSASYRSLAGPVIGGIYEKDDEAKKLLADYEAKNPHSDNVTVTAFNTSRETGTTIRIANIGAVPLHEMPMLSSWFCDTITLNSNYYGQASANVKLDYTDDFAPKSYTNSSETFSIPFNLPYNLAPNYVTSSSKAGLYVESVILNGKGGTGGRAVITPENATAEGSCVMYVTARDREQFYEKLTSAEKGTGKVTGYTKPTIIKNMVLRGEPYAWSGLQIAPNKNMSYVELDSVAIYDVHRTITLDDDGTKWPTSNNVELKVTESNLRGYTVPGSGWKAITYTTTTFEAGTTAGDKKNPDEVKTCKVESKTAFNRCYFKAPYIIDLSKAALSDITFTGCVATATSQKTVEIVLQGKSWATTCTKIEISSDPQGEPIVDYYINDDSYYRCTPANPNGELKTAGARRR